MEKNKLINKIICLIAVLAVFASVFVVVSSADGSTLRPRRRLTPEIPLQTMQFTHTSNGVNSSIASPFTLYSLNGGTLTDITRFPTNISSSGTSVSGLVSYNWRHYLESGADATFKKVDTEFHSYDETWVNLFSSQGAGTFEGVSFYYQPFKNYKDPYACFQIVTTGSHIVPSPRLRIYYEYVRYTADNSGGITVTGNSYITPEFNSSSDTYLYQLFICDFLPENANELIANYRISCDVEYNNGQTGYLSEVESVYYNNTFVDETVFNSRMANLPVGKTIYKQVINEKNPSDLLDWLGDTLGDFLSTELFRIGELPISIGTIVATIFGLLFVFMFLRFFSGG